MIESDILNDLSIIIQGKIFGTPNEPHEKQLTLQCIKSIRTHMPNAEVIISTWEGSDVSHLKFDKVVFSKDPGAIPYSDLNPEYLNNNNRQITSTYNGLKAATKKYAIKMRGDCTFTGTKFLSYFEPVERAPQFRFFKNRVVIPTKYSRNPRRIAQLIHPSDIFQFGLLEDLLDLWSIPLQPEPQTTRAIPADKRIINDALPGPQFRMKFGAEQYNWYAFCKKHGLDLELKHYSSIPPSKIMRSEMSIINNYVIVEGEDMSVLLPKRLKDHVSKDLYTYDEWKDLQHLYCVKGATKLDEYILITKAYISNVRMILKRVYLSLSYRTKKAIKQILGITQATRTENTEKQLAATNK